MQYHCNYFIFQTLIFPTRQAIATVPDINWEQYQENGLPIFDESAQNYYNTRKKKLSAISTIAQDKEKQITLKDKQNSYGQPWTEEEQVSCDCHVIFMRVIDCRLDWKNCYVFIHQRMWKQKGGKKLQQL